MDLSFRGEARSRRPPLRQFQHTTATQEDTWKLLLSINSQLGDEGLDNERLKRLFGKNWPDLEAAFKTIPGNPSVAPKAPPPKDLLPEMFEYIRAQGDSLRQVSAAVNTLLFRSQIRQVRQRFEQMAIGTIELRSDENNVDELREMLKPFGTTTINVQPAADGKSDCTIRLLSGIGRNQFKALTAKLGEAYEMVSEAYRPMD